jgi:hypothetical protein
MKALNPISIENMLKLIGRDPLEGWH